MISDAAKKYVGEGAKEQGKGLMKQAAKKGAKSLAGGAVKKAASDSYADHQEAKSKRGQVHQPKWGNSTL